MAPRHDQPMTREAPKQHLEHLAEIRQAPRPKLLDLLKRRSPYSLRNSILALLGHAVVDRDPPRDERPSTVQRKALLEAVGKWYDECRAAGGIDDYCAMGEFRIDLTEGDSWDDDYEEKFVTVNITRTYPMDQI